VPSNRLERVGSTIAKEHHMTHERNLDVRDGPPARRHTAILDAFEALDAGARFELVNDHDPKPLYHQFAAERAGTFTWDYLENGPEVWRDRIGRPGGIVWGSDRGGSIMTARLDYRAVLPAVSLAMSGLEKVVESSTLEPKLLELVKQRASQINGCAYCLDMHTKDARAIGEDEQRLHLVAVWREAPFFAPRERAALAWTEALTLLPQTGAPDDVYLAMAREFDPAEQVALTLAIVAINSWNRLAVGFRRPVGSYVSSRHPEPRAVH
jgi:AhpD family alkylhydroperoxidase